MPKFEILEDDIVTESLPLDLKLAVENKVFKLCNAGDDASVLEWVTRYSQGLCEVIKNSEEIRKLALDGKIEEAARLAKQKVEEYYGHNVSL